MPDNTPRDGVSRDASPAGPAAGDPTLERRAAIARLTHLGKRTGYGLFALAIAAFTVGAVRGFTGLEVTIVTVSLGVGSVVLAPAIVFGYGVKAAAREDRRRERSGVGEDQPADPA